MTVSTPIDTFFQTLIPLVLPEYQGHGEGIYDSWSFNHEDSWWNFSDKQTKWIQVNAGVQRVKIPAELKLRFHDPMRPVAGYAATEIPTQRPFYQDDLPDILDDFGNLLHRLAASLR